MLTALEAENAVFRPFVFKMLTALGICSKSGRIVAADFGGIEAGKVPYKSLIIPHHMRGGGVLGLTRISSP
jgi:hypothetical protein